LRTEENRKGPQFVDLKANRVCYDIRGRNIVTRAVFKMWDICAKLFLTCLLFGTMLVVAELTIIHFRQIAGIQLWHYKEANRLLGAPLPHENRVVFIGDSLTVGLPLASLFPQRPFINRGINGQTSGQIAARFNQDVVSLRPTIVVILAGRNDISPDTNPQHDPTNEIDANINLMTTEAKVHNIRVILCSLPPVLHYPDDPAPTYRSDAVNVRTKEVNHSLEEIARREDFGWLDYYSLLVEQNRLPARYTNDGWHLNAAGFRRIAPYLEAKITLTTLQ